MSQETSQESIATRKVVYTIPGVDAVTVRRDEAYGVSDTGPLTMDLYYPPASTRGSRVPAVVVVAGFPDRGFQQKVGCPFKEMGSSVSWGQLTAASGLVAITYTNQEPARDVHALLRHIRQHAASLGVDENRIGLWASSGNAPLALSVLMQDAGTCLKCAVLSCGYTLDLDGSTGVAEAAKTWGFANPGAGKTIDDLPRDLPMFIARAGHDRMPQLNATLDRFVAHALTRNLPVTLVNHHVAPHSFDLLHDSEASRECIRHMLAFMRFNLTGLDAAASPPTRP